MPAFDPQYRSETPAAAITIALYRISQAIDHLLRLRGEARQLSPAQIHALLFLQYVRPAARTIGGLAQRLGATYATASGVADALERKALMTRRPLEEDRRIMALALTEAGQEEARRVEDVLEEIEAAVTALPEEDQQALLRATQAIVRRLQESGYVHVYEMCWGCQFFRRNAHPADPRGPHHCAFVDAPLAEPNTYLECPDFVPGQLPEQEAVQRAGGHQAHEAGNTTRR
jgi:DNA-binding MarR family transcriptional regulator